MENVEENEPIDFADEFTKAATFLANLGISMQKRSESVIEKKLMGNKKLSSSQYQKVAEKLLLICDLSKKSIENFEKGLKEILKHLSKGAAEDRSDSSDPGLARESNFKVYQYGTTELKVPLSINYEYYLSSKVHIVRLANTTFEKYLALHNKQSEYITPSDNVSDNGPTNQSVFPNDSDMPINDEIEMKSDQNDVCKTNQENSDANKNVIDNSALVQPTDSNGKINADNNGDIDSNENSNESHKSNVSKVSAAVNDEKPRLKLVSLQKLLKPDHTELTVFKDSVQNKLLAEALHNGSINAKDIVDDSPSKKVITITSSDEESVKDLIKKEPSKKSPRSNIIRKTKSRKSTYKEYSSSDISQSDDSDNDNKRKIIRKKKRKFVSDSEESDVSNKNKKTKRKISSDSDVEVSFKQVKKKVRFTFDENSRPRRDSNVSNRSDSSLKENQDIDEKNNTSDETICVNVESEEEAQIRRKAVAEFKPRELSVNVEKMAILDKNLLELLLVEHKLKKIIQNECPIVEVSRTDSLSKDDLLASSDDSSSEPIKNRLKSRPMIVINSDTESDTEDEELVKALKEIRKEIQDTQEKEIECENKDEESTSEYVTSDEELRKVLTEIKCETEELTREKKPNSKLSRKISVSSSESSGTKEIKKTVASIERDIQEIILKGSNDCDFDKEGMDLILKFK